MLKLAGKCGSFKEGAKTAEEKLYNGECFNKFVELVKIQGGDVRIVKNLFYKMNTVEKVISGNDGYIQSLDAMGFGRAAVALGCGRNKITDKIDYSAGIIFKKKTGEKVKEGDEICLLIAEDKNKLNSAREFITKAIEIGDKPVEPKSKILEIID